MLLSNLKSPMAVLTANSPVRGGGREERSSSCDAFVQFSHCTDGGNLSLDLAQYPYIRLQTSNHNPTVLRSAVGYNDIWHAPSGETLTHYHLCTCLRVSLIAMHCHGKRLRPSDPYVDDCEEGVFAFTWWTQWTD